jgi:phospholipid/cholesterol/gamma-HCH transport system permease protein
MEPGAVHVVRRPAVGHASPTAARRLGRGLGGPLERGVRETGDFALFAIAAFRAIPGSRQYLAETLRQAGRIITGSALVIFGMQMVIGLSVGTEAIYILRGYGAQSYAGVFTAWATIRVTAPLMFGYILAAKVGCGLVAEIGSMRISEEVDAMEVMAIDSMRFLIATRLLGALLALPAIYVIGIACQFLTEYLVVVVQIGEVSGGAWSSVHWQYQNPPDLAYSTITAMTIAVTIVLVGLFYGYRVRGGPVEVGEATARSMVVNLVLIHLIGAVLGVIFWGFSANAPVGG